MTSRQRVPLGANLQPLTIADPYVARTVRAADAEDLAMLLYAAFRGTVDDEGETLDDARQEIAKTFAGSYGRLLPDASFVIEQDDVLASACLISWYEGMDAPFVVFTMTRPEFKRLGMAQVLLRTSMNTLLDAGYDRLTLIVTRKNEPAMSLYTRLGFHPLQEP